MQYIELLQHKQTLVDDDFTEKFADYHLVYVQVHARKGYVMAYKGGNKVYLHRLIVNCPPEMQVDHINGNSLDNRRENLRICSQAENKRNLSLSKRNTSGYKGVCWAPERQRWHVRVGGKHIGRYHLLEDAVRAYNEAATEIFGKYAKTN